MRSPSRRNAAPLDEQSLYNYAVRLLGRQMRTVAELKRLLRRRIEAGPAGEAALDSVITRLHEYRYLDDPAFAQDYTRLRQENASFGRRRVQQDLLRKGVDAETVTASLDRAYEGISEEDLARRHLERKRIRQPQSDKESARIVRLLMRAGFSVSVILRILRNWNVRTDAIAALEAEDPSDETP